MGRLRAGAAATITEFPLPSGLVTPASVAVDSSGAVWFTEFTGGGVGRFAGGKFTLFKLPNPSQSLLGDMVNGLDEARWVLDDTKAEIWRIAATGAVTGFPIPPRTGCAYSGGRGPRNINPRPGGAPR